MSDEERKKLQEKNINKLNPYKERVKKYFPNGYRFEGAAPRKFFGF